MPALRREEHDLLQVLALVDLLRVELADLPAAFRHVCGILLLEELHQRRAAFTSQENVEGIDPT